MKWQLTERGYQFRADWVLMFASANREAQNWSWSVLIGGRVLSGTAPNRHGAIQKAEEAAWSCRDELPMRKQA